MIDVDTLKTDPKKPLVKKASRPSAAKADSKKAKAKRRAIPYARVAKLWAKGKTIAEIAKEIRRVGKGDDPYHALRVILGLMHKGYRDDEGKLVKLPYRVSKSSLKLSRKAGKKAAA